MQYEKEYLDCKSFKFDLEIIVVTSTKVIFILCKSFIHYYFFIQQNFIKIIKLSKI